MRLRCPRCGHISDGSPAPGETVRCPACHVRLRTPAAASQATSGRAGPPIATSPQSPWPSIDPSAQLPWLDRLQPEKTADAFEFNAAIVLSHLGYPDARSTPKGSDGGVDIRAKGLVAQVKAKSTPTNSPSVQQLMGCASVENARPVFFSLHGYTLQAIQFADSAPDYPLFEFDWDFNLTPSNGAARRFYESRACGEQTTDELDELLAIVAQRPPLRAEESYSKIAAQKREQARREGRLNPPLKRRRRSWF